MNETPPSNAVVKIAGKGPLRLLMMYCPGCKAIHTIPIRMPGGIIPTSAGRQTDDYGPSYWAWNGSYTAPAVTGGSVFGKRERLYTGKIRLPATSGLDRDRAACPQRHNPVS
jgi:hypothetical protein